MKAPGWQTACGATSAIISVACMSSMAAALTAAGAVAGAGSTSMAGMGSMPMTGASPAGSAALPLLPSLLERIGLGFLNKLPNEFLQPLLALFLLASLATAYLAYREHGRHSALILTALSGVVMYLRIYVWMSEVLYVLGLIGLVAAGLWGLYLTRRPARVARATGAA
jgi:hypothetical protein